MKKRLLAFCCLVLISWQMIFPASVGAAKKQSLSAESAYCMDEQMYSFVHLEKKVKPESVEVRVKEGIYTDDSSTPVPLKKSNVVVRYLLMVDLSMSMVDYKGEIEKFVTALTAGEKQEAVYTVASFGEQYKVEEDNLTDSKTVIKTINNLKYDQRLTDPYTAITSALTDLKVNRLRLGGDVVNLILISDGTPDLEQGESGKEKKKEKELDRKAAKKIKNSGDVIVHTLLFQDDNTHANTSFSAGTGLSLSTGGKAAGKKIASFVDSLYVVSFPLTHMPEEDKVSVWLRCMVDAEEGNLEDLKLQSVPVLRGFHSDKKEGEKSKPDAESTEAPSQEQSSMSSGGTVTSDSSDSKSSVPWIYIIIGIAAAILIIVCICVVIFCSKKGSRKRKKGKPENAVFMKVEIISGKCKTADRDFYLEDELWVGSGSDCDLVFAEADVSKHNTRIYRQQQMIYIEDMDSAQGTVLEGMRLHAPNPLRSGDEISIGSVRFVFRF
ncbi:MAG: FHA domain-containing protein [Lachnospiraceae bacterium]|nr:FHA domain-containing protein [Lachnospiraceae bacterium]